MCLGRCNLFRCILLSNICVNARSEFEWDSAGGRYTWPHMCFLPSGETLILAWCSGQKYRVPTAESDKQEQRWDCAVWVCRLLPTALHTCVFPLQAEAAYAHAVSRFLTFSNFSTINAISLNCMNDRNSSITDRLFDVKHHTRLLYKHDLIGFFLPPWQESLL